MTAAAAGKVWPILRLDFNQCYPGGVWTMVDELTRTAWALHVGQEVIVEDFDEDEDLRFFGTITALNVRPSGKWRVRVNYGERAPDDSEETN